MLRKHFQNPVPKTSSSAGSRAVGGCFTGSVNRLFRVAQAFAFIPEAFGVWFRLPSLIFVCVIHSTFYFSHSERGASQAVSSVWNPFCHPLPRAVSSLAERASVQMPPLLPSFSNTLLPSVIVSFLRSRSTWHRLL